MSFFNTRNAKSDQHEEGKKRLRRQVQESRLEMEMYFELRAEGYSKEEANRIAWQARRSAAGEKPRYS